MCSYTVCLPGCMCSHMHICRSRRVYVSMFFLVSLLDASCWSLLLLNLKYGRGLPAFIRSSRCALDKKRLLYVVKRLTAVSPVSAIKSSRCRFWGSYLLQPLHRNVLVGVRECTKRSSLMAQLPTINVCPFLSQTYI